MKISTILLCLSLCVLAATGNAQVAAKQTLRCAILVPPDLSDAGLQARKITVGSGSAAHRIFSPLHPEETGVRGAEGRAGERAGRVSESLRAAESQCVTITD